jgi:hypothetical protein
MSAAKKSPTSHRFSKVRLLQIRECRLLTGVGWLIGTMSLWLPGRVGEKSLAPGCSMENWQEGWIWDRLQNL